MTIKTTIKGIILSLLVAVPAAQAAVLTFDEPGFVHGTVIDNEYEPLVTISANNTGGGAHLAVAFDSSLSNTLDGDLEAPFFQTQADLTNGLNPFNPGNILIIQENNSGCGDGICDTPDDEGSRPAGKITFAFTQAIELLSLDFFDIETAEDGSKLTNRIDVWDFDTNVATTVAYTPDTGGDNLWAQVLFDSTTHPELLNIGQIDVYFGGSGALDNLTYSVVPVPAAFWLFGTALIGFIGYSRRRSV